LRIFHEYRKLEPKRVKGVLKFADVLAGAGDLPPLPDVCDQTCGITDWGMDGNDDAGDCLECAGAHADMLWSANATGTPVSISSAQVIGAYSATTGYDPQTGRNDNGTAWGDFLPRWKIAPGYWGTTIDDFCEVDANNQDHFKRAINDLGCLFLGLRLPKSAEDQFDTGQVWTPTWSRIKGGHAVLAVSYGPDGFKVVTWSRLQPVSWSFVAPYVDEAYACVSPLFLNAKGATKGGLTLDLMRARLGALRAAA
jgi:hypothetical protein